MDALFRKTKSLSAPLDPAALTAGVIWLAFACGPVGAQPPREADVSPVRGTIERFTNAPMGEVDGAVLDDGTWLHWPPQMQGRFKSVLKAGDAVRATGRTETGPAGDAHFEVRTVTNLRTNAMAENPDFASAPPAPPERVTPGRPGDLEQRVRDLENQVSELRRELRRMQRER